ncbi:hypothetical protein E2542_SST27713 [Spatholobus suberectus]|nr:hypothetical protein E2542_SST27713 [Spatholobus suberectus]
MDKKPYIGPLLGNVDILVHFIEVTVNQMRYAMWILIGLEVDRVDPSMCPDEVYVSDGDDDMNYVQPENVSDSSDSESEYVGEDGDANNEDGSECISDFDERVDMIGDVHSDDDMQEIYIERGDIGRPFQKEANGKIKLAVGQLFLNVNHFREVLKDFVIQEGFHQQYTMMYLLHNNLQ